MLYSDQEFSFLATFFELKPGILIFLSPVSEVLDLKTPKNAWVLVLYWLGCRFSKLFINFEKKINSVNDGWQSEGEKVLLRVKKSYWGWKSPIEGESQPCGNFLHECDVLMRKLIWLYRLRFSCVETEKDLLTNFYSLIDFLNSKTVLRQIFLS